MSRTPAGRRPEPPKGGLSSQQVVDRLMAGGFDGIKALRIMTIANHHGINSEVLPKGGWITIQVADDGYRVSDKPVLL